MPTKPLDRLMFAQGGLCFFCNMPLPKSSASVEHLVPSTRAGSNSDDNCVACCKAINGLLGSMSLKEKLRVVLNQNGKFTCPAGAGSTQSLPTKTPASSNSTATPPVPIVENYSIVLEDLKKRGASKPRRVETLKNTIRANLKRNKIAITEVQLEALFTALQVDGKLMVEGTRVSYSL